MKNVSESVPVISFNFTNLLSGFVFCILFTAAVHTTADVYCCPPRRAQEKADLKQSLAASRHTHLSSRSQLEQEVTRLKSKVTHLELKLADTQKVFK